MAEICRNHEALLQGRDVSWTVEVVPGTRLAMPETTFKILRGNLVKNAFAYTEQGSVAVELKNSGLRMRDTGHGLSAEPRGTQGYGFGLVIVKDICRKYQSAFNLTEQESSGRQLVADQHPGQDSRRRRHQNADE